MVYTWCIYGVHSLFIADTSVCRTKDFWTTEEDDALRSTYAIHQDKKQPWKAIVADASFTIVCPDRNNNQCKQRWRILKESGSSTTEITMLVDTFMSTGHAEVSTPPVIEDVGCAHEGVHTCIHISA